MNSVLMKDNISKLQILQLNCITQLKLRQIELDEIRLLMPACKVELMQLHVILLTMQETSKHQSNVDSMTKLLQQELILIR